MASTSDERPLPHTPQQLDTLRDTLQSRGPDAGETWLNASRTIALMHRRLSVIDLQGARQPFASQDQRYHLVFNGEIYNYRELREQLKTKGHKFRTLGDTEVLLESYLEWGSDCVHQLNGIFAFAVWDAKERSLFAARDHCGVKPLYYGVWNDTLYLASEAKAIVADPRVGRRLSPEALDLYFHHSYVPAPYAIWEGMRKLEAGHRINFAPSPGVPERYWSPPFGRVEISTHSREELLDELEATLKTAVKRQTVADVPLGAFLSGGTDSSLIVAYLSDLLAEPIDTFSVGFEEKKYNELPYAKAVAERYQTRHHEITMATANLDLLSRLVAPFDEPFCDPAGLPTMMVSELARKHVTVALSGDGGDETHAGYRRYLRQQQMAWVDRLPSVVRKGVFGRLASLAPSLKRRGALEQASRDAVDRYDAVMCTMASVHRQSIYASKVRSALEARPGCSDAGAPAWWRELAQAHPSGSALLDRLQALDLQAYLPEQLMTKTDRASMSVSLEVRVPFLDLDAINFAATIPPSLRAGSGKTKSMLRELLIRRMGADFANRKKHGFQVPLTSWFQQLPREEAERILLPPGIEQWIDRDRARALLFESKRGLEFAWPFAMFGAWQTRYEPTG